MAVICRTYRCGRFIQFRNAIACRNVAGWFEAFVAHDVSKMRACFDNGFRLVAAFAVVSSGNLVVAQDRMVGDRLADRFSLELLASPSDCSRLILFRSRRHDSRGFLNWSVD